jgi:hypothetical protein
VKQLDRSCVSEFLKHRLYWPFTVRAFLVKAEPSGAETLEADTNALGEFIKDPDLGRP